MRISDWSSDVCSSDLRHDLVVAEQQDRAADELRGQHQHATCERRLANAVAAAPAPDRIAHAHRGRLGQPERHHEAQGGDVYRDLVRGRRHFAQPPDQQRSEEHTSELQSLMRISYAVFCLKKKKKTNHLTTNDNTNNTTSRQVNQEDKHI